MQTHETTRTLPIKFRETGTGPAVVLVHGWMVSGRIWNRLLPLLQDFRVIVPDLRGSGASATLASGSVTLADHVTDLVALVEALDIHDAHLVGHSMGGQLAALLAARLPRRFRTIALMNPVPVGGLEFPEALQPLFRNCGGNADHISQIIEMSCIRADGTDKAELLEDALSTSADIISTGFEAFRRGDASATLEKLDVPTTVIATDDPFLPPAFLQAAIVDQLPNAHLVHLQGPGHYPQVELPDATADLLRNTFR